MKGRFFRRVFIIMSVLVVCVGCDQSTKYMAKQYLENRPTITLLDDVFRLGYAENSGAFLSLGAALPQKVRRMVFVIFTAIFLMGFLLYVIFSKELDGLALTSSALIIGGGIGNLIDRILNNGVVIDFMNIGIGSLRTGIFNVADVAIMAGVFLFAWCHLKKPPIPSDNTASEP